MAELRYDKMVEEALRNVVREALSVTAHHGLVGDHHFYITFKTAFPGVEVPDYIRARHPDEMTIVLQHRFWNLDIGEDAFEVTLSFGGVSERLRVPFEAITGFADPSAKFGLQFQVDMPDEPGFIPAPFAKSGPDAAGGGGGGGGDAAVQAADKGNEAAGEDAGNVVALDAFRKK